MFSWHRALREFHTPALVPLQPTANSHPAASIPLVHGVHTIFLNVLPLLKRRDIFSPVARTLQLCIPLLLDPFSPFGDDDGNFQVVSERFRIYFAVLLDVIQYYGADTVQNDVTLVNLLVVAMELLAMFPDDKVALCDVW